MMILDEFVTLLSYPCKLAISTKCEPVDIAVKEKQTEEAKFIG
jgi:hypothetical protein